MLLNEADYTALLLSFMHALLLVVKFIRSLYTFVWIALAADDAYKFHAFGQIIIAASLHHYLQRWCNMVAAWLRRHSVQVDNAEPEHDDIEGKEGYAEEARGIAFACCSCNVYASPNFLAHVVLFSRIDHHCLVSWHCAACLWRCLNEVRWRCIGWVLGGSTARRYNLVAWSTARIFPIVSLATFSWCRLLLVAKTLSHCRFTEFNGVFITALLPSFNFLILPVWETDFMFERISTG